MLALSIRQPWCWHILHNGKDVENRDWYTKVRGRILIHAAKGCTREEFEAASPLFLRSGPILRTPELGSLPRGGIVGSVEIVDCIRPSASPWYMGGFAFVLRDPQPLPFRPYKGQLGFFDVPD